MAAKKKANDDDLAEMVRLVVKMVLNGDAGVVSIVQQSPNRVTGP